jgi:hypothetical protein
MVVILVVVMMMMLIFHQSFLAVVTSDPLCCRGVSETHCRLLERGEAEDAQVSGAKDLPLSIYGLKLN